MKNVIKAHKDSHHLPEDSKLNTVFEEFESDYDKDEDKHSLPAVSEEKVIEQEISSSSESERSKQEKQEIFKLPPISNKKNKSRRSL